MRVKADSEECVPKFVEVTNTNKKETIEILESGRLLKWTTAFEFM